MTNLPDFDAIDAKVRALDLDAYQPGAARALGTTADLGDAITKICEIYCGIRGILAAIAKFPLLPAKWRAALELFITGMDALCNCDT